MTHQKRQPPREQTARHWRRSLLSKRGIIVFVFGLLSIVAIAFAVQWISAQDKAKSRKNGETAKLDSKTAWTELEQSAQKRLNADEDQTTAVREILKELVAFAQTYPRTEEAIYAWLSHAQLTAALGDYENAESSLRRALQETSDPRLIAGIQAQLAEMTIRPGGTPPAFVATSLDGRRISPADYKGNVLLLDFWATWCGPCIVELPNVKRVYNTYHNQGFEIVSISLDRSEETLGRFVEQQNLSWTHIYNSSLPSGSDIASQYGVSAIPQMILIGRDGKIVDIGMRGPALEEAVKRAINEEGHSSLLNGQRPAYASLGQMAPALAVQEWILGKPATLDNLKGKVVLLDIFQIICPGCHRAHPEIARMQKRYANRGFEVLGLAVAFEYESVQTPRHIRDYVTRKEYPYPVAIDKGLTETFRRYRSRGTPFTVLIDRKGRIRYLDFFRLNQVEATVQQLLDEEAS
ncbi:tetratricopeptide repeat protein [candidate division KSB1 bacterium]|nr:tetratricopeptide repeat protein [candidate division KSB1 bacterium]